MVDLPPVCTTLEQGLKIMLVWAVSCLVDMTVCVNMIFFTSVDVPVVDLVQDIGGVAEKVPVVGDDYLI